jgi:hypothetical protein
MDTEPEMEDPESLDQLAEPELSDEDTQGPDRYVEGDGGEEDGDEPVEPSFSEDEDENEKEEESPTDTLPIFGANDPTPPSPLPSPTPPPPATPQTSVSREIEILTKNHLSMEDYLVMGYEAYLVWLTMTLGNMFSEHLRFCVARSINVHRIGTYCMGKDLEVEYLLVKLQHTFGWDLVPYATIIQKTLVDNLQLSTAQVAQVVENLPTNEASVALVLSAEEFRHRLSRAIRDHPDIIDSHSLSLWRSSAPPFTSVTPENVYPVTVTDIWQGEALAPPAPRHLGLQVFQMYRMLPLETDICTAGVPTVVVV